MRYLFVTPEQLNSDLIRIEGPDCHHLLNVLRVRVDEPLMLLDGQGRARQAVVQALEKRAVVARVTAEAAVAPAPAARITVAQALGKGDKFEQVVQHGVEAGAHAFVPITTERAVVKLDAKSAEDKRARWQLIAKGAAEQAHRGYIPQVLPLASLRDITTWVADFPLVLLLHLEGEPLHEVLHQAPDASPAPPILLLVGPEGGFSPSEVQAAREAGARIVTLGPYVLRTETAALVAIGQIQYHYNAVSYLR